MVLQPAALQSRMMYLQSGSAVWTFSVLQKRIKGLQTCGVALQYWTEENRRSVWVLFLMNIKFHCLSLSFMMLRKWGGGSSVPFRSGSGWGECF